MTMLPLAELLVVHVLSFLQYKEIDMLSGAERMRISEVAEYCGVSKTTVHIWIKKHPDFPKAIRPSKRTVYYRRSELDRWLDSTRK